MSSSDPTELESVRLFNAFETVMECLKRMETVLIGMKQVRAYVGEGLGRQMLESLIEEAEKQIAEVKLKVIQ
jgi:ABC-type proline/glycine betaine transport system permease subunit